MNKKRLAILTLLVLGAMLLAVLWAGGGQVVNSLASVNAADLTNQQYAALQGAQSLLLGMSQTETLVYLPLTIH
jgi:hypothetical protein